MKIFKINFYLIIVFSFFLTDIKAQNKKQQIIDLNEKIDSLKNKINSLDYKYNTSLDQYNLLSSKFDSTRKSLYKSERINKKLTDSLYAITSTNKLKELRQQRKIDSLSFSLENSSYNFIGKLIEIEYQMGEVNVYTFKLCAEGDFNDEHIFHAWSRKIFSAENISEGNIYEISIGYDRDEAGYLIITLLDVRETQKRCDVW